MEIKKSRDMNNISKKKKLLDAYSILPLNCNKIQKREQLMYTI